MYSRKGTLFTFFEETSFVYCVNTIFTVQKN